MRQFFSQTATPSVDIFSGRTLALISTLYLVFIFSCGQPNQNKETIETNNKDTVDSDSLIDAVFKYGQQYLDITTFDSIVAINGKPISISKEQWGVSIDSLITAKYSNLVFHFFKLADSKIEISGVSLFDKNISIPANLTIGKTTRQDILHNLGLPTVDHNDPGRTLTKSGDTTTIGISSGAGDTVTFIYYINIDEYFINLSMTKDTLREISWSKNMN